jgi:hypothetical protein
MKLLAFGPIGGDGESSNNCALWVRETWIPPNTDKKTRLPNIPSLLHFSDLNTSSYRSCFLLVNSLRHYKYIPVHITFCYVIDEVQLISFCSLLSYMYYTSNYSLVQLLFFCLVLGMKTWTHWKK